MSRLVVKNLPNKISSEKLKEIFSQKGEITDVQLKYTKDGKFRNFGFIGFRTEEQAAEAQKYFDGSCVKTTKISVEVCASLGDAGKPRAWSKYAPDSTAYAKLNKPDVELDQLKEKKKDKKKKKKKENKIKEILRKHKDDPLFAEFIDAHTNDKTSFLKDALNQPSDDEPDSGVEDEGDEHDAIKPESAEVEVKVKKNKTADKNISDLEYMKSLMKKKSKTKEAHDADDVKDDDVKEKKGDTPKMKRELFHVKINNLPYKCKKRDIKEFFRPLVPFTIRFPLGKGHKVAGFCYVGFRTEDELKKALFKDKLFLGSHRLHVSKHENKPENHEDEIVNNVKRKTQEENLQHEESIGESGRIFVRNLPYITTEDELTQLFEKYGPLADINMPVDKLLRQPKGFATVTFLMPEHAVRAYSELDGSVFSGRMLHLLPGKTQQTDDGDNDEGLTFKEKKAKKLKSQAKSSHNWNSLFLGANAVADVVAETYDTTKERLLNEHSNKTSAAVRLALGETQLVSETRSFLEENGVCLDAFTQASKKRSKTCILVKNLPARTTSDELRPLFEKHGLIARFVMPKHGITVLIEFVEPSEARSAFTKLAYSQFKSSPLYLEWAPDNAFLRPADKVEAKVSVNDTDLDMKVEERLEEEKVEEVKKEKSNQVEEVVDEDPEPDTTLFVKNLNFKTIESSLREHFQECGKLYSATVAKKKDPKNPGNFLSMGYGFVQFFTKKATNKALKELQYSTLDGKTLELKRSDRGNNNEVKTAKKSSSGPGKQTGSKILVRNVPFQANRNELHEIFRAFGEIKTLRLPKKLTTGDDQHRGFCFVDYYNKSDAKMAFDALCHSTHLYGRRLVLEWADQTDENEDVEALRKRTAETFNQQTPGGKRFKKSVVDAENLVE